jgi:replicative DNA helicase
MAEFGEEATGVFNKDAIEDALRRGQDDFPYPGSSPKYPLYGYAKSLEPNPLVHRIVGVDWDKYGAGTQIVVIEASRAGHDVRDPYAAALDQPFDYIRVIHRREIPKSKFTLANAVRALVNINELFTPQFYYLDAGYGEHQIESLQILGMEQDDPNSPLYGFQHKIVRVNFSHGVEVLDPVSKKIEKRRVKPEMVNRLVNKFDTGEMVMSPFDDELKNQLINYVVTKITASGEPKYGTEDPDGREHAVDALMLAVWGLYSEFGVKLMKSSTKAFIERPIGERYLEMTENVRKKQERSRPDYVALAKRGEIDDDMINDEIKFAKAGMLRRDQITTAAGVPTEPSSRLESNTTFQRGGARGHTGRRGSF